jgi:exopolyphosphatase / guanosine-5'-triphosphate,3'-diphosphate pyrophosphatase
MRRCICLFFVIFTICVSCSSSDDIVVRAAIDIGSGRTNVMVVEYNTSDNSIEEVLYKGSVRMPYQYLLSQNDEGVFDEKTRERGREAFQRMVTSFQEYNPEKTIAVATAAFRDAENGEDFAAELQREFGIPIYVVDQETEGKIAFYGTAAKLELDGDEEGDLVAWDIGEESFHLTISSEEGKPRVFRGDSGSRLFRNRYYGMLHQGKTEGEIPSLSVSEVYKGIEIAKAVVVDIDARIREKIEKEMDIRVAAIGNIFNIDLYNFLGKKRTFTIEDLQEKVEASIGKSFDDFDDPLFAREAMSNALLVLGVMEELAIKEVEMVLVDDVYKTYFFPDLWK